MDLIFFAFGLVCLCLSIVALFSSDFDGDAFLGFGVFFGLSVIIFSCILYYYHHGKYSIYYVTENKQVTYLVHRETDPKTGYVIDTSNVVGQCLITVKKEFKYSVFSDSKEYFTVGTPCDSLTDDTKQKIKVVMDGFNGNRK